MCSKIHLVIDANAKLVEAMLSGGREHDVTVAESLTQDIIGCYVLADKGYDSKKYRQVLENQNNVAVIPPRKLWKQKIAFDKSLYKKRSLIERVFGKLKENKRIATRYDKMDLTFLSFICIAFIKTYL